MASWRKDHWSLKQGTPTSLLLSPTPAHQPELRLLSPHFHPLPPPSVEKLSSMKPVPGVRKAGDCWSKQIIGVSQARSSWKEVKSVGGRKSRQGASEEQKKTSPTGMGSLGVEAGGTEVRLGKVERPPTWWGLLGPLGHSSLRAAGSQQRVLRKGVPGVWGKQHAGGETEAG